MVLRHHLHAPPLTVVIQEKVCVALVLSEAKLFERRSYARKCAAFSLSQDEMQTASLGCLGHLSVQ